MATELNDLPADADEPTRKDLAERLVPYVRSLHARHPGLRELGADAPGGANFAKEQMNKAIVDLYNPAQIEVIGRLRKLLSADD